MALLHASGFENGSGTLECTGFFPTSGNTLAADTGTKRSGSYSLKATAGNAHYLWYSATAQETYTSFYINIATSASAETSIYVGEVAGTFLNVGTVKIGTDDTLRLSRDGTGATLVATSAVLSKNAWHKVVVYEKCLDTGGVITLWVDDVQVGTYTGDTKPDTNAFQDHNIGPTGAGALLDDQ